MGMATAANCSKCQGAGFIYYYPTGRDLCDCIYGRWRKEEMKQQENSAATQSRKDFEDWYVLNCSDLAANPIGSRECHLQWRAWSAALSRLLEAGVPEGKQQMFIRNGQSGTGGTQDEGWLNISDIQKATGEFAERTFPKSTPQSVINHFKEEAGEFAEAGDPEEAADCLLLLCHHAHKMGYSLLDEAAKKLRKNMKRKWATEPNAQGYFKHVDKDHPPSDGTE